MPILKRMFSAISWRMEERQAESENAAMEIRMIRLPESHHQKSKGPNPLVMNKGTNRRMAKKVVAMVNFINTQPG